MPLTWTIDPHLRLVTAVAKGNVTRPEVEALLDDLNARDAHGYRKLFDGEFGETSLGPADILALGVRMRSDHRTGPMGPLAVVLPEKYATLLGHLLGMLASAKRPMRVFPSVAPARRWLESVAPADPGEPEAPIRP